MSFVEYAISPLRPNDYNETFDFMQNHFRIQEPITRALDTSCNDSYAFYRDLCNAGFKTPGASLAVRSPSNELIGVALNGCYTYDELEDKQIVNKTDFTKKIAEGPYESRNANRLIVFIEHVESGLRSLLPSNAKVFKLDILAIRADYCRRGIGRELLFKTIELARSFACSCVVTCATARASHQLFQNNGFRVVRCVPFQEFMDNNVTIYKNVHDGGDAARLEIYDL
ncbi:N-acetyltransferase domain-containing protein [Aphelenchoides besseyi]|nr:N-acetyltransferase domain-containing protein [Aphelenchoides besseyi]